MRRMGGGLAGLLVWIAAVALPVVALPATACAAEDARAVLVVDTGEAVQRYCVALLDDEVSGLELIVLAGEQHGLSYRFGYGGAAVCMLAGVGTTGDDCFERYPDFWGYWRGSSGGWTWSSTGAGNTTVRDGDVEGWSWGSGSDGSSHRRPPATTFGSVCSAAASPKEEPERSRPGSGAPSSKQGGSAALKQATPSRSVGAPTAEVEADDALVASREPGTRRPVKGKTAGRERRRPVPVATASEPPDLESEPAAAVTPESEPGAMPPATGLAALGAAALLGGAGFVLARRRRGDP